MFQKQSFMGGAQVQMRGGAENPLGPGRPTAFGSSFGMQSVSIRMGNAPGAADFSPSPGMPPQGRVRSNQDDVPSSGGSEAPKSKPDKAVKAIVRMCDVLRKLAGKEIPEEIAGRIFWSYADHANLPPDMVTKLVQENCPDLTIPPRPTTPSKRIRPPEKEGFRGKTRISYEEARELSELLDVVLAPLTPEEAASELADRECLRELTDADGFPIVERLQERLKEFIATAQPTDTFEISHGEATVTGKAVECADALGRLKTVRTVATVGGVAAGGSVLLLLLGII